MYNFPTVQKNQYAQKRGWNELMLKPHSSFIDIEGLRLHYLEWEPLHQLQHAEDNIPIVLLHGLGATADSWNLVAEQLCREHLVIAFDQRGHGQSEQAQDGYDLVTMAEDCIRGMAALGLGQVVLAGHGWGARVALVLAARHPALLSHLVLVDCPHVEPRHWPGMTRERFIREKLGTETYPSAEAFLETMQKEMESFWSAEVAQILLTYVQQHADGSVGDLLKSINQKLIRAAIWDDRALSYYGKLACPVLLVPAAAVPQLGNELPEHLENADEFASAKGIMAAQVARIIRQCTIAWMPDTSHDIQFQRPQRLAEVMTNFIR
jgi:pimeloyl-ACP methyl ester carboxylesterase